MWDGSEKKNRGDFNHSSVVEEYLGGVCFGRKGEVMVMGNSNGNGNGNGNE